MCAHALLLKNNDLAFSWSTPHTEFLKMCHSILQSLFRRRHFVITWLFFFFPTLQMLHKLSRFGNWICRLSHIIWQNNFSLREKGWDHIVFIVIAFEFRLARNLPSVSKKGC